LTTPSIVVEALTCHRARQAEDRRLANNDWTEAGLIFTTSTGRHGEPRNLDAAYERPFTHAGILRIRFHDLRHACATLLLSRRLRPVDMESSATPRSR
jgi:integrase